MVALYAKCEQRECAFISIASPYPKKSVALKNPRFRPL